MKRILLTGATGYIGKRMINVIAAQGYQVICCCRDKDRFSKSVDIDDAPMFYVNLQIFQVKIFNLF